MNAWPYIQRLLDDPLLLGLTGVQLVLLGLTLRWVRQLPPPYVVLVAIGNLGIALNAVVRLPATDGSLWIPVTTFSVLCVVICVIRVATVFRTSTRSG